MDFFRDRETGNPETGTPPPYQIGWSGHFQFFNVWQFVIVFAMWDNVMEIYVEGIIVAI